MALQLTLKCVSSAGTGSKGWPFTPAPLYPSLRLHRASPVFRGTGCRDARSGVQLQDLTPQQVPIT